jgi:hypothetical protein
MSKLRLFLLYTVLPKLYILAFILYYVFIASCIANAADYSVQQSWVTGETITATKLNADLVGLTNTVNSLDNDNISDSAGIVYSKLTLTDSILNADIHLTDTLTYEGATADEFETNIKVTDPTADRDITFPNVTGTVITTGNLTDAIPAGIIVMWSGTIATIPSGWALCDGDDGTPDLSNRFVIAADADDGGVAKTTVTGSATKSGDGNVKTHNHSYGTLAAGSDGAHTHSMGIQHNTGSGGGTALYKDSTTTVIGTPLDGNSTGAHWDTDGLSAYYKPLEGGAHTHTISGSTANNTASTYNVAVYYALAYIMKL